MARIKTGSIVGDITGKVGDQVYSRNKYGPYVKTHSSPTIPQYPFAAPVRSHFAAGVDLWNNLSESEYIAWESFCRYFKKNSFHNGSVNIHPRDFFLASFMNLYGIGLSDAPVPNYSLSLPLVDFDLTFVDSQTLNLTLSSSFEPENLVFNLLISAPCPLSVRSFNSRPRYLFVSDFWESGSYGNIASAYQSRFQLGFVPSNSRYFVELFPVDSISGVKYPPVRKMFVSGAYSNYEFLGFREIGASNSNATPMRAMPITPSFDGEISDLFMYAHNTSGTYRIGIYSDNMGEPDELLAISDVFTPASSGTWHQVSLPSPLAVFADIPLWLGFWCSTFGRFRYFTSSGASVVGPSNQSTLIDPFGSSSPVDRIYSLFCVNVEA